MCELFIESSKIITRYSHLNTFEEGSIDLRVYNALSDANAMIASSIDKSFNRDDVHAYLSRYTREDFKRDNDDVAIADTYVELYDEYTMTH